tara:strand:+ start:280 stop:576 length:297 start_codon:yes stop_codon:yes gene_type:complete
MSWMGALAWEWVWERERKEVKTFLFFVRVPKERKTHVLLILMGTLFSRKITTIWRKECCDPLVVSAETVHAHAQDKILMVVTMLAIKEFRNSSMKAIA